MRNNFLSNLPTFMDGARAEVVKQAERAATKVKTAVDNGANGAGEWVDDRTSLVAGDSLQRLQNSGNPLITLERREVPRRVSSGLLYLAAASGVLANSAELTRLTRAAMDDDKSLVQQLVRSIFSPDEAREISAWMDHAPGFAVAGGYGHRLHHGHDLAALLALKDEFGHTGVIEWLNHVWLRDFWTPHGIPILPVGSGSVYDWLVDIGVSPSTALGLLSINAAEAASGLLFINAGKRAWSSVTQVIANRAYSAQLTNIKELAGDGLDDEALRQLDRLEVYDDPKASKHLKLDLALFCLGMSLDPTNQRPQAWGSRAFRIADQLCIASTDTPATTDYQGGTEVSFAGLAGTVAVMAFGSHVQTERSDASLIRMKAQVAVRGFIQLARAQTAGWSIKGVDVAVYRPFSAMTNQLMALELAIAVTSLTGPLERIYPIKICEELLGTLQTTRERKVQHLAFLDRLEKSIARVFPIHAKSQPDLVF